MSEAVAVPKPASTAKSGSGKTVFAGVMVFVLLVAFATAFYFLGGVDLVSGIVDGWFAAAPPSSSSQEPPKSGDGAPAVVPPSDSDVATATELKLPEGVDKAFAKRVYVEMLESQENINKLVAGEVASFSFGKAQAAGDKVTVPLTAVFTDKSSAPGTMQFEKKGGKWYLAWVAGGGGTRAGLASSVAVNTEEDSPQHLAATAQADVDDAVLGTILEQQAANQDVISGIIGGTWTAFTCDGSTSGPGTVSIDITLTGPNKTAMKGRVLCISKDIDGMKWFLTSFAKS